MQPDKCSAELGSFPRSPLRDPRIEAIWVAAAGAIGWRVERGSSAYASSDGHGTILIGVDDSLDAADAVAQLVFHELCHGLVAGPEGWSYPDWGLATDDRDVVKEHACLRVQVHLAEPHGLRELMTPTTEYRAYHDALVGDPLVSASDPSASIARAAVNRRRSLVWIETLGQALAATRAALDDLATMSDESIGSDVHPAGFDFAVGSETCGTCAWLYVGGRGHPVERCRQSAAPDGNGRRTEGRFRACVRWESPVDCHACGACCREAYHSVTVSVRDPVVWKQPDLVERHGHRFEIRREGERCAALEIQIDAPPERPMSKPRLFSCAIYDDRPRACRDFEAGGRHCLVARQRVGLSP
jgi:hypothetical protein